MRCTGKNGQAWRPLKRMSVNPLDHFAARYPNGLIVSAANHYWIIERINQKENVVGADTFPVMTLTLPPQRTVSRLQVDDESTV